MLRLVTTLALGVMALSCQKDATQLIVLVNTDYAVPTGLAFVTVRISDLDGQEISASEFVLTDSVDPGDPTRFTVPFSFGVVPIGDDASRRIVIDVDGLGPARELKLTRRAITGFVSQRTLLLPMFLARSCEDVTCDAEDQTCTEEGCVTAILEPGGLREILPGEELLDGGADGATDSSTDALTTLMCDATACTCEMGSCAAVCTSVDRCDVACNNNTTCTVDSMGTTSLSFVCANTASCAIDATMVEDAQVECRDTSNCDVDCANAVACDLSCAIAAECILRCTGSPDCRISTCASGMAMSCPGNVIVCGTDCP